MIDQLENSIHILGKIHYKVQHCFNTVLNVGIEYELKEEQAQTLTYTALELGIILVVSYLDEYNGHFGKCLRISKSATYCNNLSSVIKDVHSEINKLFPDLNNFRNYYLAHNMRVKKKENIFLNGAIRSYKVPQNIHDYFLLTTLLSISYSVIQKEFPETFGNISQVSKDHSNGVEYVKPIANTGEEAQKYVQNFLETFELDYNQFRDGVNP